MKFTQSAERIEHE